MTYVVTDACIRCKFMDCVEVCPVECFREGENMLVIDPDGCIDCNACLPECPAEAIRSDNEPGLGDWIALNATYSAIWPAVSVNRGQTPADAEQHKGETGKFEKYFSPNPGEGD